jgi:hypothetical protein
VCRSVGERKGVENPDIIVLKLSNTLPYREGAEGSEREFEIRGKTRHPTDSDRHNFQWKTLISERESSLSQIIIIIYTKTVRETPHTL